MTDSTTIALAIIAAVPPTLASLAALMQGIRNGVKADAIKNQNETIDRKVDVVHESTNGTLTDVKNDLRAANTKIETLNDKISSDRSGKFTRSTDIQEKQ